MQLKMRGLKSVGYSDALYIVSVWNHSGVALANRVMKRIIKLRDLKRYEVIMFTQLVKNLRGDTL